jgi:hypothetical protein
MFTIPLLNKLSFVGIRFAKNCQTKIETFKEILLILTKSAWPSSITSSSYLSKINKLFWVKNVGTKWVWHKSLSF